MYELDLNTCTAIEIIQRSITCHPSLFIEALQDRANVDYAFARQGHSVQVYASIMNSASAAIAAIEAVKAEDAERFRFLMGAGIIALDLACKLQCIPAHVRTAAALRTWDEGGR